MPHPLKIIARKYRVWILLTCGTVLYFFASIQRVAIPGSIFNVLQQELQVSAPYITGFGSSFMYIYAISQLAIGLMVDRYGGGRVIAVGAFFFCAGSLLFPLSHNLEMLYLSRALTGLGASSLYLSLVREVMRSFNKNFTIMLAIILLVGKTGGIVANAPLVMCINRTGWRYSLLIAALISIGFYLLFMLTKSSLKMPSIRAEKFSLTPFLTVLKKRHNHNLCLFAGINFGLYYVLQTVIGKKFLEDFCMFSSDKAAVALSVMGLISSISGLCFAVISRMLGNRRQIFVRIIGLTCLALFSIITLLIYLEIHNSWMAILLYMLAAIGTTQSIAVPLVRETNATNVTGVSVSVLNFSCFIAVALFGNVVGLLMNLFKPEHHGDIQVYSTQSYLAVFGCMLICSAIVTWTSFQLRETMGEHVADSTQ